MMINPTLTKIHRAPDLGSGMQDYVLLYSLVRAFQAERILEIGTHQGASTIAMCQAVRDNKREPQVWTLDSWEQRDAQAAAAANILDAGFGQHVTMVEGDSRVTAPAVLEKNGPMDIIFIDGDHSCEGALADYRNCCDHTGILLFHDATGHNVRRALNQVQDDGWALTMFPTTYVEGDGHAVGLCLAMRT